ncbi:M15 family metallopeptidase [Flavobacterium reichenbachii]|uniref:D-alanyl-D-alanine dipeptidase n=1 Tax=Flavobacterium reichenbachii TaxID=362418 RepID=A0A085ZMA3_9FLAO|nr:M15 family metallopeptidase [Flavobacterium reichenbachii]KFF05567.1 peptidase M15 [Flavobacterium reichenbachii]OXB17904.1 peptidase M15 [Flavobacterium reichenbachii]
MISSLRTFFLLNAFFFLVSANAQKEAYTSDPVVSDTSFVNLKEYSKDFVYDMKYATEDNFLKAKVYDCAECLLRLKTVQALVAANIDFMKKGYKIKLYDCYRPLSIQKKMWEIVSNPSYVADPKKGSIHNRGGAVDISLVDANGIEVEMGTSFDFFGFQASHNYTKLPKKVLANRKYLKEVMIKNGFNSFDSEWWHYNLKTGLKDKVSNQKWDCN